MRRQASRGGPRVELHPSGISGCAICGPENRAGLQVRFRRRGDVVSASFVPRREHQGFHGLMSGGLLSAIFDCLHYRVPVLMGVVPAVTARLEVQYRAPIPLGRRVRFEAHLVQRRGRVFESRAVARLADGRVAAESTATYVEIPSDRLPPPAREGRGRLAAPGGVR